MRHTPLTALFRRARPALALGALVVVAACGQKGPLYLPGSPSEMQPVEAGGAENADEDDSDNDDEEESRPQ